MTPKKQKITGRTRLFANVQVVRITLDCPLPEDLVEHIDALAANTGMSRTAVCRQAIIEHFGWSGKKVGKSR